MTSKSFGDFLAAISIFQNVFCASLFVLHNVKLKYSKKKNTETSDKVVKEQKLRGALKITEDLIKRYPDHWASNKWYAITLAALVRLFER